MIRVLLLAGGQSEEHEVSLNSAKSILSALPKNKFAVTTTVISRQGRWLPSTETVQALERGSAASGGDLVLQRANDATQYDVVFPILHGPFGEDGTVQGLLKLAGIPCVGSGVLGSAVCMDKLMTKAVLAAHNIPQVNYVGVTKSEWTSNPEKVLARIAKLSLPVFVKPANLGSSVGISKCKTEPELRAGLVLAFQHDRRVIVEAMAGSHKPRELEVAILGNDKAIASPVGELTFATEFYDYQTKYTDGQAEMHIPANVPVEISERIRVLALQAFELLDCAGLARIDFFYTPETGDVFLNEVNTMPGFTRTSMYPKLMEAAGVSYPELVSRLVELGLER